MRTHRSTRGVPGLLLTVLTLSGCASLLDIEEGQPKPATNAAAGSGGANTGGAGGSANTGGKAGASAQAGNAGAGAAGAPLGGAAGAPLGGAAGAPKGGAAGAPLGGAAGSSLGGAGGVGGSGGGGAGASAGASGAGNGGASAGSSGSSGTAGLGGVGGSPGGSGGGTSGGQAGSGGLAGTTSGAGGAVAGAGGAGGDTGGAAGEAGGIAGAGGVGGAGAGAGGVAGAGGGGPTSDCTSRNTCTFPGACNSTASAESVTQIVAGATFTCALSTSEGKNRVWCWGDNKDGQLGRPATSCGQSATAIEVRIPDAARASVSPPTLFAGATAHAACLAWGTNVACWGTIGGRAFDSTLTIALPANAGEARGGSVGQNFVFARGTGGISVRGDAAFNYAMQAPSDLFSWGGVTTDANTVLAAGAETSCAVQSTSVNPGTSKLSVTCKGSSKGCLLASDSGPCPAAGPGQGTADIVLPGLGSGLAEISLSESVACASRGGAGGSAPTLYCWGDSLRGDGNSSPVPTDIIGADTGGGPSGSPIVFAVGERFVARTGPVGAGGAGGGGGFGAGGSNPNEVRIAGTIADLDDAPIAVASPPFTLSGVLLDQRSLAAGSSHLCGLVTSGAGKAVACVGSNKRKQAGNTFVSTPSKLQENVRFEVPIP